VSARHARICTATPSLRPIDLRAWMLVREHWGRSRAPSVISTDARRDLDHAFETIAQLKHELDDRLSLALRAGCVGSSSGRSCRLPWCSPCARQCREGWARGARALTPCMPGPREMHQDTAMTRRVSASIRMRARGLSTGTIRPHVLVAEESSAARHRALLDAVSGRRVRELPSA
jgi:hypothetical protein